MVLSIFEALPLELQEVISLHLLPCIARRAVNEDPIPEPFEYGDLYNLRLTSRCIKDGASRAFVRIIEDIPTGCRPRSLSHLASLVALPGIGESVTSLTFSMHKLDEGGKFDPTIIQQDTELQLFATTELLGELLKILCSTPRLRHLICFPHIDRAHDWGAEASVQPRTPAADPMLRLQKALKETKLNENLETFIYWTQHTTGFLNKGRSPVPQEPLHLPNLTHLTFNVLSQEFSGFRVSCPNLSSLHVILGDRSHEPNLNDNRVLDAQRGLDEYTISGRGAPIETDYVLECIGLVSKTSKLTIRDVVLLMNFDDDVATLPDHISFETLVLADVRHTLGFEFDLSESTRAMQKHESRRFLAPLCERAGRVCVKMGSTEQVLERLDWECYKDDRD